jgi:hypothetical protein
MTNGRLVPILGLLFISKAIAAADKLPSSEPVVCYQVAWESREKGGFGLTAGQAVTLCSGATDARKVLVCFANAWGHPDNGGLGLNAGQAVTLCKTNSLQ